MVSIDLMQPTTWFPTYVDDHQTTSLAGMIMFVIPLMEASEVYSRFR
jgi:hypothetical protein